MRLWGGERLVNTPGKALVQSKGSRVPPWNYRVIEWNRGSAGAVRGTETAGEHGVQIPKGYATRLRTSHCVQLQGHGQPTSQRFFFYWGMRNVAFKYVKCPTTS